MIFLSYSSQNQSQADRISDFLSDSGFEHWVDGENLRGGDQFEKIILKRIETARCVVVLLTKSSLESDWVRKEIEAALACNVPIIPISNVPAVELRKSIGKQVWASKLVQSVQFISYNQNLTSRIFDKLYEALKWRLSSKALAKVYSFVNFKGGIGKTSLCASAACSVVSRHDKRVLLIDLDPQENLSDMMLTRGALEEAAYLDHTALSLFEPKRVFEKVGMAYDFKFLMTFGNELEVNWSNLAINIAKTKRNGVLSVIPADYRMMKFSKASAAEQEVYIYNFSKSLRSLAQYYDFIFIDSGPSASLLSQCALKFSDHIIAPVRADYNAVRGLYSMQQAALNVFDCDIDGKTHPLINFFRASHVGESTFARDFTKDPSLISDLVSFVKDRVLTTRIPQTAGMIKVEHFLNQALRKELEEISFGAADESMQSLADELLAIASGGLNES